MVAEPSAARGGCLNARSDAHPHAAIFEAAVSRRRRAAQPATAMPKPARASVEGSGTGATPKPESPPEPEGAVLTVSNRVLGSVQAVVVPVVMPLRIWMFWFAVLVRALEDVQARHRKVNRIGGGIPNLDPLRSGSRVGLDILTNDYTRAEFLNCNEAKRAREREK
jgi:hypothetical protein